MAAIDKTPSLNACIIGHVDSGKSTTVGMFALAKGLIDQRAFAKFKAEAENNNKPSFALAYFTDNTEAERKRGITIQTTLKHFPMNNYQLNILDCPGHKDFIKNMITGAAQADVAVAIVPSPDFEASIAHGATLQDHMMIAGILGIKQLIICITKLDMIPEDKQKGKFEEIKREIEIIAKNKTPFKAPIVIPISGVKGVNLTEDGPKFSWFDGFSYQTKLPAGTKTANAVVGEDGTIKVSTLEGALNAQEIPKRPIDKPLRMPITEIHSITGFGLIYTGRVDSGFIRPGMQVSFQPSGVTGEVKTLQIHRTDQKEVVCGENVGMALKSGAKGNLNQIRKGNVISETKNNPCQIYQACKARLVIIDHPKGIKPGFTPVMDLGSHHVPVKFVKFVDKVNPKDKVNITEPEELHKRDLANVILVPQKPTIMEKAVDFPTLARFCVRDSGNVVAIGTIQELYTEKQFEELGIDLKPVKKADKKQA